ncbi:MAG: hypothetical protein E7058_08325 [Lentisphaerae bacterium]|nr:hypothetical protein [Lentisphaerota bacterium]
MTGNSVRSSLFLAVGLCLRIVPVCVIIAASPLPLSADDIEFVLVENEEFGGDDDGTVIIHKERSTASAATAYDDPDIHDIEEDDLSEVCGVIMFTHDENGIPQMRYVQTAPPQRKPLLITAPAYSITMPQVNFTVPASYNTSTVYVTRRYVPGRRTYVYRTIRKRPPPPRVRHHVFRYRHPHHGPRLRNPRQHIRKAPVRKPAPRRHHHTPPKRRMHRRR